MRRSAPYGRAVTAAVIALAACSEDPVLPSAERVPRVTGPRTAVVVGATLTDLGTLGGENSYAYGINEGGYVVGISQILGESTYYRAVRWSPDGEALDLGFGGNSAAYDINDAGQVVGYAVTGAARALLWDPTTGVRDIGTLPSGTWSIAKSINRAGQVVGYAQGASGRARAFAWTAGGGMRELAALESGDCNAQDVNDDGVVAGLCIHSVPSFELARAVVWSASGSLLDLGTLGGTNSYSYATGVGAGGEVVGTSQTSSGAAHAFRWTLESGMRDLGTLGGSESHATSVNDKGEIAGYSYLPGDAIVHPFLWTPDGGMRDLGGLEGAYNYGNTVSRVGQVAGSARTSAGFDHAARWTLVYENHAPAATAGGPYQGLEGAPVHFLGTATDADGDPVAFGWEFGDGSTAAAASADHVYADDGTFTATLTATDRRGLSGTASAPVVVANVAPTVRTAAAATIYSGDVFSVDAAFADPGTSDSPWNTVIDWGDGPALAGSTADQRAPVAGSHRFFRAGRYSVRVGVTDKDGGVGSAATVLDVLRYPTTIDVAPKDATNTIRMSGGGQTVDVALMATSGYDPRLIDVASVVLTNGTGAGTHLRAKKRGLDYDYADIDGDGRLDVVITFAKSEMVANGDLTPATTTLILLADGLDRRQTRGESPVVVRP